MIKFCVCQRKQKILEYEEIENNKKKCLLYQSLAIKIVYLSAWL